MLSLSIGIFLVSWIAVLLIPQEGNLESVFLSQIAEFFRVGKTNYVKNVVVCRIDDHKHHNQPRL